MTPIGKISKYWNQWYSIIEEDSKEVREIDQIFEELENAVDDHYNEKDGFSYGGSF